MRETKAGRELDAMIADKVMGDVVWDVVIEGCSRAGAKCRTVAEAEGLRERLRGRFMVGDIVPHSDVPAYSTDIGDAWLLIDHFTATTEWEPSLDYEAPRGAGGQGWCATFGHHEKDAVFAYGATAPLAICRAALAAVGAA